MRALKEKDLSKLLDDMPSVEALEAELSRENYRSRYSKVLRNTIYTLITVAAVAVLVATLWMPVFQTSGSSMTPTLSESDFVVSFKTKKLEAGDIVAFYINNKILVKRVIAKAGDWVNISEEGIVSVNGHILDEPYIDEPALGDTDLEYPYQVPEKKYFVMGDHRSVSIDSRNSTVGCVSDEDIVGKIIFCVWPLPDFGKID